MDEVTQQNAAFGLKRPLLPLESLQSKLNSWLTELQSLKWTTHTMNRSPKPEHQKD